MVITVDGVTGERIQREMERGAFQEPGELLAHALDLVEAEGLQQDWLLRNKAKISADLDATFLQAGRGEGYSADESRALLAGHRSSRAR